jgi:hypothetical protein
MLRLSDVGSALTLSFPAWVGLLSLALGVALVVYVFRGKAGAKAFGASVVALIFIGFSWYCFYSYTRFDEKGVVVRGAFGIESVTAWSDIAAVGIDRRGQGRGAALCLILTRVDGPEVLVTIGTLDDASRVRLLEYARQRVAGAQR